MLMGFRLFSFSKEGVSSKQHPQMLGVSYKTAWFIGHRIREATGLPALSGPIGGRNKAVESDETYVGGFARNAHMSKPAPKKHPIVTLVKRGGEVRAKQLANVTTKHVRDHLVTQANCKSVLMSDESNVYTSVGKEFAKHP